MGVELINTLKIQVIDISELAFVHGRFPDALGAGSVLLLRPDRLVFGHTDASISLDSLLERFARAIKYAQSA